MTEYAIVYRSGRANMIVPATMRWQTTQAQAEGGRSTRLEGAATALRAGIRTALRLGLGVTLTIGGVAITGGSFGLLAFIGIPMLAVGLGVITSEPQSRHT